MNNIRDNGVIGIEVNPVFDRKRLECRILELETQLSQRTKAEEKASREHALLLEAIEVLPNIHGLNKRGPPNLTDPYEIVRLFDQFVFRHAVDKYKQPCDIPCSVA